MPRPFNVPGGVPVAIAVAFFPFGISVANLYFGVTDGEVGVWPDPVSPPAPALYRYFHHRQRHSLADCAVGAFFAEEGVPFAHFKVAAMGLVVFIGIVCRCRLSCLLVRRSIYSSLAHCGPAVKGTCLAVLHPTLAPDSLQRGATNPSAIQVTWCSTSSSI